MFQFSGLEKIQEHSHSEALLVYDESGTITVIDDLLLYLDLNANYN